MNRLVIYVFSGLSLPQSGRPGKAGSGQPGGWMKTPARARLFSARQEAGGRPGGPVRGPVKGRSGKRKSAMLTKKIRRPAAFSSGFLRWETEGRKEQREVGASLSLGRGGANQLVIEDSFVSRRHARIERQPETGSFVLKDMGSRNGVFLNGNQVYQAVLSHNDSISVGGAVFQFSFERYSAAWELSAQSRNEKWSRQLSRLPCIAQNSCPVLILGPSGSGKEILARLIHKMSRRGAGPMLSINCSAMTESLIESELFGHTRGSYTGAAGARRGAFLSADEGTLFLDEIGDLPLSLQPKLLRAIEYSEIKPVGADIPVKTNVRIISATHQSLQSKAENQEFRKDLFYRLNVVAVQVPALKDRMEDFEPLLQNFAARHGAVFSLEAQKTLRSYHWPGNIRELKNTVIRAKALFMSEVIDRKKALLLLDQSGGAGAAAKRLPAKPGKSAQTGAAGAGKYEINRMSGRIRQVCEAPPKNLPADLKYIEKLAIKGVLKKHKGSQSEAAEALGMSPSTFGRRLKKYRLKLEDFRPS